MDRKPISFGEVVGIVWKVLCALVLIPFVILLVVIAMKVVPGSVVTAIAFGVLIVCLIALRRMK